VAPLLILFLTSLVQFALIYERQIGIENAVREAARRTAAIDFATSTPQQNATWAMSTLVTLLGNSQTHEAARDDIEVCILTPAAPDDIDVSGNPQAVVRVKESYRHPVFLPLIDIIIDGIDGVNDRALLVTTTVEFRVEQDPDTAQNIGTGAYARTNVTNTSPCVP